MSITRHVHHIGDGRGFNREVLLNGKPITGAVYADPRRGLVRVYREPLRLDKHRKRALTKTLRGKVEVIGEDA